VRLDESWAPVRHQGKRTVVVARHLQAARDHSLSVEENSKQHIVALCLLTRAFEPRSSRLYDVGGLSVLGDIDADAIASNHPLICKIRSRSTPVCSPMRPQCVALEYGLGEADN
jgi:hypothetical protein